MKTLSSFKLTVPILLLTSVFAGALFAADSSNSPIVKSEFVFLESPCHASTIAETHNESLVCAWMGGHPEGSPYTGIWSSTLSPNSSTWTEPQLIGQSDGDGKDPCWNPVLFQPHSGPLCLFYKQGTDIAKWQGVLLQSDDAGKTWKDRRVLPEGFIGPVKNKPIELKDGTILCPSSTEHMGWRIHFEFIPDLNKTWSRTQAINSIEEGEAIQPSILKYKDGRLQAVCRNRDGNGRLWQTWSDDQGKTWQKLQPLELPNPNSGIDAVTLQDGRQLLVYNHTNVQTGGRNVLNVAVSQNGLSWQAVCVLENEPYEYSYPSVIQTKDGLVHIVYTWRRERIRHVVLDPSKIVGVPIVDGKWPQSVK